jgi:hypothetical protein
MSSWAVIPLKNNKNNTFACAEKPIGILYNEVITVLNPILIN